MTAVPARAHAALVAGGVRAPLVDALFNACDNEYALRQATTCRNQLGVGMRACVRTEKKVPRSPPATPPHPPFLPINNGVCKGKNEFLTVK